MAYTTRLGKGHNHSKENSKSVTLALKSSVLSSPAPLHVTGKCNGYEVSMSKVTQNLSATNVLQVQKDSLPVFLVVFLTSQYLLDRNEYIVSLVYNDRDNKRVSLE